MNGAAGVLAAGGMFAGGALLGLGAGIWIANATGRQLWIPAGLFCGLGAGAYSAVRQLMRQR